MRQIRQRAYPRCRQVANYKSHPASAHGILRTVADLLKGDKFEAGFEVDAPGIRGLVGTNPGGRPGICLKVPPGVIGAMELGTNPGGSSVTS